MPLQASQTKSPQLNNKNIVILAGGVGGAKLADGMAQIAPAGNLTVIVNTGDDFRHFGLAICPDIDTVTYTLAGEANPETGWGRAGETWRTIEEVKQLGGPDWFRLGDLDLAAHLTRTHLLRQGQTLTQATDHLRRHLGTQRSILPMSDDPAPTLIETDDGILSFQEWFVERRWQPAVRAVRLPDDARATPQVMAALEKADLVIIAPSNPFVSIDPILNVYPIRAMIIDLPELVIAVSPIIGGEAVKGPAAKMMREMQLPVSPQSVADHYGDLIDVFVYDVTDKGRLSTGRHDLLCTDTLMRDRADRERLAQEIVNYSMELNNQ